MAAPYGGAIALVAGAMTSVGSTWAVGGAGGVADAGTAVITGVAVARIGVIEGGDGRVADGAITIGSGNDTIDGVGNATTALTSVGTLVGVSLARRCEKA